MTKELWMVKIREITSWVEELITFCLFPPVPGCSEKLPNYVVLHVDLTQDLKYVVPPPQLT